MPAMSRVHLPQSLVVEHRLLELPDLRALQPVIHRFTDGRKTLREPPGPQRVMVKIEAMKIRWFRIALEVFRLSVLVGIP